MLNKKLEVVCLIGAIFGGNFVAGLPRKFYPVDSAKINSETTTVDLNSREPLGKCMCDITANACDAYCCCDLDCDQAIRDVWNSNYDQICAKNFIRQVFKPE